MIASTSGLPEADRSMRSEKIPAVVRGSSYLAIVRSAIGLSFRDVAIEVPDSLLQVLELVVLLAGAEEILTGVEQAAIAGESE